MKTNFKQIEKIIDKKQRKFLFEKQQREFKERFVKKETFRKGKNQEKKKKKLRAENQKNYSKERRKTDPKFNMVCNLRSRVSNAIKLYSKNGKTRACKEYGIDFEAIFNHVGPRPDPSYHLDHIIPLSLFDLDNPEQVRLAHVPRNLRWLPGRENLEKNNKIDFQAIICSLQLRTICLFIGVDIFDKSQWL